MTAKSSLPAHNDTLILKLSDGTTASALCIFSLLSSHPLQNIAGNLHINELAKFESLKFEKGQRSYLIGRYAAKQAIAVLTNESDLRNIVIEQGVFNQPIVKLPCSHNFQTSISHCNDIGVAVAFQEAYPMGIDVEGISIRNRDVMESQLTEREKKMFRSTPCSYDEFLARIWTGKEALSKILKTGLGTPFHIFEISRIESNDFNMVFDFEYFSQYTGVSLNLGNYMLSIVYPQEMGINVDVCQIRKYLNSRS